MFSASNSSGLEFLTDAVSPVPRWVRLWSYLTATVTLLLLFVLGGFVTSFRVGMSDPVWPTEPWFLLVNGEVWIQEPRQGFLIEHTHRAAGWIVGLCVSILALGSWLTEPNQRLRILGIISILTLIALYGQFHREMMSVESARRAGHELSSIPFPYSSASTVAIAGILCLSLAAGAIATGSLGCWVRAMSTVSLIAVMIQGLLGGFRVLLDQLFGGTFGLNLAAFHGAFAQIVFSILISVCFLATPRRHGEALSSRDRLSLGSLSGSLTCALLAQLIWGVWLRHYGTPVSQRLHIITAFLITMLSVWLITRSLAYPERKKQLSAYAWCLSILLVAQILLGIEGWLSKYVAEIDPYTNSVIRVGWMGHEVASAIVRTAHVVIGTALLATSVVTTLRIWCVPLSVQDHGMRSSVYMDSGVRLGEPMTHS